MNVDTDKILADAEIAKTKDAGEVTALVTDPFMDIPDWLRRSLTDDERAVAWGRYCADHGIVPGSSRAPARGIESQNFSARPPDPPPDLRAIDKAERDRIRITKMKAGLERKAAEKSGATRTMPLTGKDALAKIRGE